MTRKLVLVIIFCMNVYANASWVDEVEDGFTKADTKIKIMESDLKKLTAQVMTQQFYMEQRVKTEGQSGIKQVRQRHSGYKNYYVETHNGHSAAAIHDHANNIRTVGLGEFVAVLNGVEFSTRHNDYRLVMPHRTSAKYHAVEDIPFPDVPPDVSNKRRLSEQIKEMREWFKAWRDENESERNYKKYFKPILCYLEGSWTKTKATIDEPFHSDRHFIDAPTWEGLSEKLRYVSYSGSKSLHENLSFLPTKIIDIENNRPVYAQWNYRILCHPLKQYLSKKTLNLVDDLSSRMMNSYNIYRHSLRRPARFTVKDIRKDRPQIGKTLLDKLMEEIPGKDNYQGMLFDEGLDTAVLDENMKKKDVSRYHRVYSIKENDAMGSSKIHRGFSDSYLYAAMTTQKKIAGMNVTLCKRNKKCRNVNQKWTYAIPLEIIYLTPLSKWNPYRLIYHGKHIKNNPATKNRRYGSCDPKLKRELNGTNSKRFYQTPHEFYSGYNEIFKADTLRRMACVLNKHGEPKRVRASGTYVTLPKIKDVGILRQRYPIFPVHGEGSSVWKELNALKDIVMDMKRWQSMLWNDQTFTLTTSLTHLKLEMSPAISRKTEVHSHLIEISSNDIVYMKAGKEIRKTTTIANGHQHKLRLRWDGKNNYFYYYRCDGKFKCWDNHDKPMVSENDDDIANALKDLPNSSHVTHSHDHHHHDHDYDTFDVFDDEIYSNQTYDSLSQNNGDSSSALSLLDSSKLHLIFSVIFIFILF